jgi:hypothetical protein
VSGSVEIKPLGAGDLIDRAVRLYRRNFWTLVRIAAPPTVVSALGSVLIAIGWREALITTQDTSAALYIGMLICGAALWLLGLLLTLMVMGGASRNLVRHLLWFDPITFKETYRTTFSRFWSLLGASLIIAVILGIAWITLTYIWIIGFGIAILLALPFQQFPVLSGIIGVGVSLLAAAVALWLFFLVASRFAYVPQIMLVEGQGVFSSIGRSVTLAGGNVKRLAALVIFTMFAIYSALMILLIPLGWAAYANGVEIFTFEPDLTPAWYLIGWQVIWQISWILLTPVWMIGLSILYVDERVRREGYDIELMAARQLGEIPPLPRQYANPLHPALSPTTLRQSAASPPSTLGLN